MKIFFGTRKFLSGGVLIFNRGDENISKKGGPDKKGVEKKQNRGGCDPQRNYGDHIK